MNQRLLEKFIEATLGESIRSRTFDLREFKSLDNLEDAWFYAIDHLKPMGGGSSRSVFIMSSSKVLKLTKPQAPEKGIAQNENEHKISSDPRFESVVPHVFEHHRDFNWLISELVRPLTNEEQFQVLTGIDWSTFINELRGTNKPTTKFARTIINLAEEMSSFNEFSTLEHWGKTFDGRAVILDTGWSFDVSKHY